MDEPVAANGQIVGNFALVDRTLVVLRYGMSTRTMARTHALHALITIPAYSIKTAYAHVRPTAYAARNLI
jgi:hypothetical protein